CFGRLLSRRGVNGTPLIFVKPAKDIWYVSDGIPVKTTSGMGRGNLLWILLSIFTSLKRLVDLLECFGNLKMKSLFISYAIQSLPSHEISIVLIVKSGYNCSIAFSTWSKV